VPGAPGLLDGLELLQPGLIGVLVARPPSLDPAPPLQALDIAAGRGRDLDLDPLAGRLELEPVVDDLTFEGVGPDLERFPLDILSRTVL
jgi:hypothetical protein